MTAKINIAIDDHGNYVKIQDAVKGQLYFCLNCGERLIANIGDKNIHFYRHHKAKDRKALIECELYSSGDSDYNILLNEQNYENKIRFIIDKSLNMKMKLPYLSESSISRMNFDDLYFSIKIQSNRISSTALGKRSNRSYVVISPSTEYIVELENKRNAELLEYEVEESVRLFQRRATLFKRINGEYINIPYAKTNLSNEFFLLSMKKLSEHQDLKMKNYYYSNEIHIYHFYLQDLTDTLIQWFKKETGYTIIPNRKWIDLVYPNEFQYDDSSMLVETNAVAIKVTPYSEKDELIYFNENNQLRTLKVNKNGIVKVKLEHNHSYTLRLNHEICNELTLKRVRKIGTTTNYLPNILLDGHLSKIESQERKHIYSVESEKNFYLFNKDKYPIKIKTFESELPQVVHFPFIGTIYRGTEDYKSNPEDWDLLLTPGRWSLVKNSDFMYVLNRLKESNLPKRSIYITKLLKNYNKLPEEIIKILKGGC